MQFILILSVLIALVLAVDGSDVEKRQVSSIFGDVTSNVGSLLSAASSEATGVFQTVTSIGGTAVTIVTSEGGQAITLASSGVGQVTSFGGSQYTAATAAIGSAASSLHSNAAGAGVQAIEFTLPAIAAVLAVVGGTLAGAWITL